MFVCSLEVPLAMESYKDAHSGKSPTIDTSIDQWRKNNYDLNCQRLDAIIDYVILCGKTSLDMATMMLIQKQ